MEKSQSAIFPGKSSAANDRGSAARFAVVMSVGLGLLLLACAASISFGAADMSLRLAWSSIFHFDPSLEEHQIIRTFRLPRTAADLMVGCGLAVCGAVMQGTTRNPLADSGLLGISAGSTFAIALCMSFLPQRTYMETILYSCLGAALATGLTYYLASVGKRGMTPQKLVLAGISISMLFSSFSTYLAIRYDIGQSLDFWTAGGTANVTWQQLGYTAPLFVIGLLWSIAISPSITILSFGEELAGGLGLNAGRVMVSATVVVLVLTGLATIIVGPISFVGLVVPHIVRYMVGVDYRFIVPASMLYGGIFLVAADLLGRMINRPYETPLGIIFALVGVPYFLYLVRKQRREFA